MLVFSGTRPTTILPRPVMTHRTRATAVARLRGQELRSNRAPAMVRMPTMMNDAFIAECIGEQT
jgi:hypothetical protein